MADLTSVTFQIIGQDLLSPAANTAGTSLDRLGQSGTRTGSILQTALGAGVVAGVTALAGGFAGAVSAATGFERQMSAVGAVAGATGAQMQSLTSLALQLGKDTSFSATTAAQGLEELVKAGVGISDILGGAGRAALDLAAAGAVSVSEAATIASNAMNTFGISGANMSHVADQIAGAANASAIDVHEFGFSLSAVGAVAATVGVGFEDLTTAIAVMGQAGLKGSDAGTSLKTMLLNLNPQSKAATQEMRALGIITAEGANRFFDATGKAKSMAEIAEVLKTATAGLTQEQRLNALQTIFGTDAIRAAAIMARNGAAGFDEMAAAIGKVSANDVANARLDNLSGSLEKLKGSVETAAITVGLMLTPALKGIVDAATDVVNTAIPMLEQIPDIVRTIGQVFARDWSPDATIAPFTNAVGVAAVTIREQFGGAIEAVAGFFTGTLVPALQTAGEFVAQHTELIYGLGVAFASLLAAEATIAIIAGIGAAVAALASPVVLVTGAIALLAAAWIGDWGGIQEITLAAWAAIQPTFAALVDWLGTQIPPVLTWISETGWPGLVTAGQATATFVTGTLIPGFQQLVDVLGPPLVEVTTWISGTGWPGLVTAGTAVGTMVTQVTQFFTDLFTALEQRGVFTELQQIWDTLTAAGNLLWAAIQTLVGWVQQLTAATQPANQAVGAMTVAFTGAGTAATTSADGVNLIAGAIKFALDQVTAILAPIQRFIDAMNTLSQIKLPQWNFPSIPGMGGVPDAAGNTTPMSYTGGADSESKLRTAYGIARQKGYTEDQANALLGTLRVEGGLQGALGDSGRSHGPMQLYEGGQFGNFVPWLQQQGITGDPKELAKDVSLAVSFALDTYYGAALQRGSAMGLSGPDLATYAQRTGQVSIHPERAGGAYGPPSGGTPLRDMQRIPLGGATGMPSGWNPQDISDIVDSLPPWERGLEQLQQTFRETDQVAGTTWTGVSGAVVSAVDTATGSVQTLGENTATMISDGFGNTVAIVQDGTGQVVAQYQGLQDGVTANVSQMGDRVTISFHELNDSTLAVTTEMGAGIVGQYQTFGAGAIGAATTMAAGVTEQAAALATGVQAQTDAMSVGVQGAYVAMGGGVTSSVQQMGAAVVTTLTDTSGNSVSIVTNQNGQVLTQYQAMNDGTTATVNQMGDEVVTTFHETSGEVVSVTTDATGQIVRQWRTVEPAASSAAESFGQVADAISSMPQLNMRDTVKNLNDVEKAAHKALSAVKDLSEADPGGSKGDSSGKGKSAGKSGGGEEGGRKGFALGGILPEDVYGVGPSGQRYLIHGGELVVPPAGRGELIGAPVGGGIDYEKLAVAVARALRSAPPVIEMDGETVARKTRYQDRRYDAALVDAPNGVGGMF